jgi:uncharacterized membrane protein YjgN (DUF898 family)
MLRYDGTIGGLYRIYLPNLLLTIVTLGIYRFWGVTRIRRYVWANTSMEGDAFEYDGTGKQLFLSFLLAGAMLFGLALAAGVSAAVVGQYDRKLALLPVIALELLVVILALAAPFSAQRYRLSHSLWRGIRGGMEGSAVKYGIRSLAYYILAGITLYQLLPWAALRLRERLINASYLGDLKFSARGRAGRLYLVFLATFVAIVALGGIVAVGVWTIDAAGLRAMALDRPGAGIDPATHSLARHAFYYIIGGYLAFGIGGALISCAYTAAFWRNLLGGTQLGGLQLGTGVSALTLLGLLAGNVGILAITLGFGQPIVIHRTLRFYARNVLVTGALDAASIRQSTRPVSGFGEGMFQQLDAGAGLV